MLTAHPALAIPDESPFVHATYRALAASGQAADLALAWRLIHESDRFRQWGLPAAEVERVLHDHPPSSYPELVRALFAAYARWRGKDHSGDKTTGNALLFPWLADRFPQSRFVHIVRDPREVCMSRVVQIFNTGGLPGAARHWRAHVRAARAASASVGERMLEVRYERLVSSPREQLERLCSFLGLAFEPTMLEHASSDEAIPRHEFDVHAREALQPGLRSWRNELSRDDVSVIEFIASDLMEEVGYEREVGVLTPGAAAMMARELIERARERWLERGAPALGKRLRGRANKRIPPSPG
jgi:hypothetical protein